jgi:hypothetical protein
MSLWISVVVLFGARLTHHTTLMCSIRVNSYLRYLQTLTLIFIQVPETPFLLSKILRWNCLQQDRLSHMKFWHSFEWMKAWWREDVTYSARSIKHRSQSWPGAFEVPELLSEWQSLSPVWLKRVNLKPVVLSHVAQCPKWSGNIDIAFILVASFPFWPVHFLHITQCSKIFRTLESTHASKI